MSCACATRISASGAVGQAAALAQNLGIALNAALSLQNARSAKTYSGRGGDPRDFIEGGSGAGYQSRLDYEPVSAVISRLTPKVAKSGGGGRKRSGGSSGGGAARVSDEVREAEREAARVRRDLEKATLDAMSSTERYNKEVADLAELHKMGYLSANEFERGVAMLDAELQDVQFEKFQSAIDEISSSISQAIVNGENMGEAFSGIFKRIAADFFDAGLSNLFSGFASGSGAGGGFLGKVFAGFFDNGGSIPSGKVGVAGELGPELIKGPAHVVSRRDTAKMMSGGGKFELELTLNDNLELDARLKREASSAVASQGPSMVVKTLRQTGNQGSTRKVVR